MGMWILWRTVAALSRVREAIQPTGSLLVTEQVQSTVLVFVLPGFVVWVLGGLFSGKRVS